MKQNYENRYRFYLTRRTPVIIRLDGKAFHALTEKCKKPFDGFFIRTMLDTARYVCNKIQGAKCAYIQSDEISILLTDFDKLNTQAWFDYNLQKIVSISAAYASTEFSRIYFGKNSNLIAVFDSRAFNVPKEEVCNYFIWRQQDWIRNSIQMLAQAHYSHKELHKKNTKDMHEMLYAKNVNWANLPNVCKNGAFIYKKEEFGFIYSDHTIFKENRDAIEQYLNIGE